MPFDLSVFDQGDVWVDEYGWQYRIAEMSRRERGVLARWLRSHVKHFYAQVLRAELSRLVIGAAEGRVVGEQDADLPELVYLSADDWLDGTMLVRRLTGSPDAAPASSNRRGLGLFRFVMHRPRTFRRGR